VPQQYTSAMAVSVLCEIRSRHFPNKSIVHYRYNNLFVEIDYDRAQHTTNRTF